MNQVICPYYKICEDSCAHKDPHPKQEGCYADCCPPAIHEIKSDNTCQSIRKLKLDKINER